jgi:hypothetical protein
MVLGSWDLASLSVVDWPADPVLIVGGTVCAFFLQAALRRDVVSLLLGTVFVTVGLVGLLLYRQSRGF